MKRKKAATAIYDEQMRRKAGIWAFLMIITSLVSFSLFILYNLRFI